MVCLLELAPANLVGRLVRAGYVLVQNSLVVESMGECHQSLSV
jgi:hypothetical protein